MAEGRGREFPVPIALLEEVFPQVSGLIEVKEDETRFFDQRESVTVRQHWINEGKWLGCQKRLTAANILPDAGIAELRIAIGGVHGQRGQILEPLRRQHRIEVEPWTHCVQVGGCGLC